MVRAGGSADAGDKASTAERGWELAGAGGSGDSERGLAWDLVQKRVLDMCNPPVRSEQWIGAWNGVRGGRACLCGGARRRACVRAVRGSGPSAGESAAVRRAKGKPMRGPGVAARG